MNSSLIVQLYWTKVFSFFQLVTLVQLQCWLIGEGLLNLTCCNKGYFTQHLSITQHLSVILMINNKCWT